MTLALTLTLNLALTLTLTLALTTTLTLTPTLINAAWGVFDGHGSQNGTLVAEVASATIEHVLRAHWARLRSEPEHLMTDAFGQAHRAVIAAPHQPDPKPKPKP